MQIDSRLDQLICKYIVETYLQNSRNPGNWFKPSYNLFGCKFIDVLNAKEICKDDICAYIGRVDDYIYVSLSGRYLDPLNSFEDLRDEKSAWIKAHSHFNRIIQSLFFVKKLYDNGLIMILKSSDDVIDGVVDDITKSIPHFFKHKTLLQFIEDSYLSEIIPTSELIDLYKNDFKNKDQIRYENQLNISIASLKRARISNYIAIVIGMLTLLASVLLTKCIDTRIDLNQHNELIEMIKSLNNGKIENAEQ